MSRRAWLMFWAMGLMWGIPYLLIKVAVKDLPPAALVLCRTGIAAAVLVPVALVRGQLLAVARRWRPLAAYTVVELAVPWYLLPDAERSLPSSLTGLLVASVPLVGAVLALATRHEGLRRAQLVGLVVGLAGVGVLAGVDVPGSAWSSVAEVAVVAVGYAAGPLILARCFSDLPGLGVVAASLALCAAGYLPLGLADMPSQLPSWRVVVAVVVLALVCTVAAFLVFFALIAEIGPVRSTVITYVNPMVAVALGVVFLHESAGLTTLAGAALILAGSLVSTRRPSVTKTDSSRSIASERGSHLLGTIRALARGVGEKT